MYSNAHEVSHIKHIKAYDISPSQRLKTRARRLESLTRTVHEVVLAVGVVALGVLAVAICSTAI